MNEFRVNVTPEQSRIVQETLFKLGYKWYSGTTHVSHTSEPVLCISPIDKDITYSSYHMSSNMTFDQFKEKYMEFKLPEKWCIKQCEELKQYCKNELNKVNISGDMPDWYYYINLTKGSTVYWNYSKNIPNGYTEITFEQFVKHILKQETMEKELKVTKEYVLELARLYPETKDKLKVLFPKTFEDDKYFDIPTYKDNNESQSIYNSLNDTLIEVRRDGNLENKSLFLNPKFNWEIVKDNQYKIVLVPTKKQ